MKSALMAGSLLAAIMSLNAFASLVVETSAKYSINLQSSEHSSVAIMLFLAVKSLINNYCQ
jgi:hypothetical protein